MTWKVSGRRDSGDEGEGGRDKLFYSPWFNNCASGFGKMNRGSKCGGSFIYGQLDAAETILFVNITQDSHQVRLKLGVDPPADFPAGSSDIIKEKRE